MKQSPKSILGVTLLEIMLVLAIAAVVIMTSVKFYKSASQSQQTTAVMEMTQAIITQADNLAQGASAYAAVTQTALAAALGGSQYITTQWGGFTIVAAPGNGATSYELGFPASLPTGILTQLNSELSTNPRITVAAPTATSITYDSTK